MLPFEVRNDTTIRSYTRMNQSGTNVIESYQRLTMSTDRPSVIKFGQIVDPGFYNGDWVDVTDQVRNSIKSSRPNQTKQTKAEEIEAAERLLAMLQGGN